MMGDPKKIVHEVIQILAIHEGSNLDFFSQIKLALRIKMLPGLFINRLFSPNMTSKKLALR
jgi:hypothetical protein